MDEFNESLDGLVMAHHNLKEEVAEIRREVHSAVEAFCRLSDVLVRHFDHLEEYR
jgi:hypothetical protein